jgi:hypothetical protein
MIQIVRQLAFAAATAALPLTKLLRGQPASAAMTSRRTVLSLGLIGRLSKGVVLVYRKAQILRLFKHKQC